MASLSLTQIRGSNSVTEFTRLRLKTQRGRSKIGFLKVVGSQGQNQGEPDLSVTVNGLHMPNPFVIGSGPPGTNYTVMKRAFDEGWGAVIAKTVSFFTLSLFFSFLFNIYIYIYIFFWDSFDRVILEVGTYQC
jgi:dihydropyrimidine dehydrogenase (NADP+)